MSNKVVISETGQPANTTTIKPTRGERGTGTTITIDLSEQPLLLADIKAAAKSDDRDPSKWLRRRIIQLADTILGRKTDPPTSLRNDKGDIL